MALRTGSGVGVLWFLRMRCRVAESTTGAASGGPIPASRGLLVGAAAGAVVAFLLLAADQALRSRRRNHRAGGPGSTTPS